MAVVALARHVDEAGNEALQRVGAHKYGDTLALLQVEDAGYGVEQLVLVGLEQLVARKRVEDVQQSLAVVTRRRQPGSLEDPADLEPQQRNRARTAAVGEGREKAEEDANAGDFTVRAEPPHSDGIHVSGPVNRRAAVRLGDDQKFAATDEILHVGGQRRKVAQSPEDGMSLVAENPERPVFRIGGSVEEVFAVAKKGEIIVVEPAQKILNLGEFGGRSRGRPRRQFGYNLSQDLAHILPVGHRRADVGEDTRQCLRQPGEVRRILFGRDLDLHPRFARPGNPRLENLAEPAVRATGYRQYRMDYQMNDTVAGIDRSSNQVDQERHVVIDDLDYRVRRRPSIHGRVRVVHPDLGLARAPTLSKAPQRQGGAVEISRRAYGNVDRRDVLVKLRNEPIGGDLVCRIEQLSCERRRLVDERCLLSFDSAHDCPFDPRRAWNC